MTRERVQRWVTRHPRIVVGLVLLFAGVLAAEPAAAEETLEFTGSGTWLTDGGP